MKKRILTFILTFIIGFSVISLDYIDARATEFVPEPPVYLSVGTGLLSLMAISGVLPEVAMLGAFTTASALGAYTVTLFTSYVAQKSDIDTSAVDEWLTNLQHGICDTSSDVFDLYREWIQSLTATSAESASAHKYTLDGIQSNYYLSDYSYITIAANRPMDFYIFITSPTNDFNDSNNRLYIVTTESINTCIMRGWYDTKSYGSFVEFNSTIAKTYILDGKTYYVNRQFVSNKYIYGNSFSSNRVWEGGQSGYYPMVNLRDWYKSLVIQADTFEEGIQKVLNPKTTDWANLGGLIGDGVSVPDLSDLPLSGSDSIAMNLENVVEKLGSLEGALDQVLGRDISITDYQDAIGVHVVDGENVITIDRDIPISDYVPNPEFAPTVPVAPDTPSYSDTDFTVTGLKEIFPFCIPFDLIDFITSLKAEPVAPNWNLSASFLGSKFSRYSINVNLSSFDPLAKICRKAELLLFIISLILITRHIIKG